MQHPTAETVGQNCILMKGFVYRYECVISPVSVGAFCCCRLMGSRLQSSFFRTTMHIFRLASSRTVSSCFWETRCGDKLMRLSSFWLDFLPCLLIEDLGRIARRL